MSYVSEIDAIKSKMKSTWEAGDYGTFAKFMEPGAIEIFMTWNIGPGQQMLDVGCGAGQIAIPAAKNGVRVTGVDIASNLIQQACSRAQASDGTRAAAGASGPLAPAASPPAAASVIAGDRLTGAPAVAVAAASVSAPLLVHRRGLQAGTEPLGQGGGDHHVPGGSARARAPDSTDARPCSRAKVPDSTDARAWRS